MFDNLKIAHRLWFISVLAGSLFLVSVIVGWWGLTTAERSLKTVFEDRVVCLHDLSRMGTLMQENYGHILRAFQHDPNNPLHTLHDHPVSTHLDAMEKGKTDIDALWTKYMATYLTDQEKGLAADFVEKRKLWVAKLEEAKSGIAAGNYSLEAMARFLKAGKEERKVFTHLVGERAPAGSAGRPHDLSGSGGAPGV